MTRRPDPLERAILLARQKARKRGLFRVAESLDRVLKHVQYDVYAQRMAQRAVDFNDHSNHRVAQLLNDCDGGTEWYVTHTYGDDTVNGIAGEEKGLWSSDEVLALAAIGRLHCPVCPDSCPHDWDHACNCGTHERKVGA